MVINISLFLALVIENSNNNQLDPRWSIVLSTPQNDFFNREDQDDFMNNSIENHPIVTTLAQVESFDAMDDFDVICI